MKKHLSCGLKNKFLISGILLGLFLAFGVAYSSHFVVNPTTLYGILKENQYQIGKLQIKSFIGVKLNFEKECSTDQSCNWATFIISDKRVTHGQFVLVANDTQEILIEVIVPGAVNMTEHIFYVTIKSENETLIIPYKLQVKKDYNFLDSFLIGLWDASQIRLIDFPNTAIPPLTIGTLLIIFGIVVSLLAFKLIFF